MVNTLPNGVAILAKTISVHAETLAQKHGIPVVYGVADMQYDAAQGIWSIGSQPMPDRTVLSMDGHENQLVYHDSGRVFRGSISTEAVTVQTKPLQAVRKAAAFEASL